ncbi:MAG: bifunctional methylenetetrahydrofolate dehydrogenase/methenyltetrahydrofolate cyclohydrolase FolD [Aeromonas sp.]
MTARILDGQALAAKHLQAVQAAVTQLTQRGARAPCLAVLQVGENAASSVYVARKTRACAEVGITSRTVALPERVTQAALAQQIALLNADTGVDGILLQLPLPPALDSQALLAAVDPRKDVDGFHPTNLGALLSRAPRVHPCTPKGVMALLASTSVDLVGLKAVIVGASTIVGRPLLFELTHAGCTVTLCHSRTRDVAAEIAQADIVVAALGQAEFVQGAWLKSGAIVIDVGINRLADGRLVGDVDFASAKAVASFITPVPGGVGPMTVACLLENTLSAYVVAQAKEPV